VRKLFSSIITLGILFIILWAAGVWYFGNRTEQQFKTAIQNNNQVAGEKLIRAELISYTKTLIGAHASLNLSSDLSFVNERIGDIPIIAVLLNGPLFFTKSDISTGSAHWELTIDVEKLGNEQREYLQSLFIDNLPSVIVRTDFDQKANYLARINTTLLDALITGVYDLKTQQNRGSVNITNFKYGVSPNQLNAEEIKISYQHQKAITSNYKPGTMAIQINDLQINHKNLKSPLLISLKGNSNISSENENLNGFVHVSLKNILAAGQANGFPLDTAEMSLQFKQISTDGFIEFSEATAELANLRQQANWALQENGELPEGQDQLWQLYERIDKSTKELPKLMATNFFNQGKSKVSFELSSNNSSGKSTLLGDIKLSDNLATTVNFQSIIDVQAEVKLDDEFYKMISTLTAIDRRQFKLNFKDNRLLMK